MCVCLTDGIKGDILNKNTVFKGEQDILTDTIF